MRWRLHQHHGLCRLCLLLLRLHLSRHLVSRHLVSRLRPSSRLHLTEATIVEAREATDAGATKAADVTPTTEATIVTW